MNSLRSALTPARSDRLRPLSKRRGLLVLGRGTSWSKLAEPDVVKLILSEQLDGQEQQAVDDVSNRTTDGLSARSGAEIQITELGIDPARPQGRQMQSNP